VRDSACTLVIALISACRFAKSGSAGPVPMRRAANTTLAPSFEVSVRVRLDTIRPKRTPLVLRTRSVSALLASVIRVARPIGCPFGPLGPNFQFR